MFLSSIIESSNEFCSFKTCSITMISLMVSLLVTYLFVSNDCPMLRRKPQSRSSLSLQPDQDQGADPCKH